MRKNDYEVKSQAVKVMNTAIDNLAHAVEVICKFAEVFGFEEDQDEEVDEDLEFLVDAVCAEEPDIPRYLVDRVIRTAFDLLEDDEYEDEEDEDEE